MIAEIEYSCNGLKIGATLLVKAFGWREKERVAMSGGTTGDDMNWALMAAVTSGAYRRSIHLILRNCFPTYSELPNPFRFHLLPCPFPPMDRAFFAFPLATDYLAYTCNYQTRLVHFFERAARSNPLVLIGYYRPCELNHCFGVPPYFQNGPFPQKHKRNTLEPHRWRVSRYPQNRFQK